MGIHPQMGAATSGKRPKRESDKKLEHERSLVFAREDVKTKSKLGWFVMQRWEIP